MAALGHRSNEGDRAGYTDKGRASASDPTRQHRHQWGHSSQEAAGVSRPPATVLHSIASGHLHTHTHLASGGVLPDIWPWPVLISSPATPLPVLRPSPHSPACPALSPCPSSPLPAHTDSPAGSASPRVSPPPGPSSAPSRAAQAPLCLRLPLPPVSAGVRRHGPHSDEPHNQESVALGPAS